MQEQLAMNWYYADFRGKGIQEDPPSWLNLTEARRNEIKARVELVLTGEIRRSEMSPGDRAVYFGRYRFLEQQPPSRERDLQRTVWWDCLEFKRINTSNILFGVGNVGNWELSNLPIGGMISSYDQAAYLCGWYLSICNEPELAHDVEHLFSNAVASVIIGDLPVADRRLLDLYREPQPLTITVPKRRSFGVRVEFFGMELKRFQERLRAMGRDQKHEPFRLWIHLEGWHGRSVMI